VTLRMLLLLVLLFELVQLWGILLLLVLLRMLD
jgi:hypothetical protein